MLFSIIIPVYNTKSYLNYCIDSIINQTLFNNYEVILVDDGSTDGSGNICDEYGEKYNFVHVIHNNNEGVIEARNMGISCAKGDYIGFVDSDDWVKPNLLQRINNVIKNNNYPNIICFESEKVYSHKVLSMTISFSGYYSKKALEKEVYQNMIYNSEKPYYSFGIIPALWNKFFERKYLEENLPLIDKSIFWGEDGLITYTLFLKANNAFFINESLYCWRYRKDSVCHRYNKNMYENTNRLCKAYRDLEHEYPCISETLNYYVAYIFFMLMFNEVKNKKTRIIKLNNICNENEFLKAINKMDISELPLIYRYIYNAANKNKYIELDYIISLIQWIKERKEFNG